MTDMIILRYGDRKVHFQSFFILKSILSLLGIVLAWALTHFPRAGLLTNKLSSHYCGEILSLFSCLVLDRSRTAKCVNLTPVDSMGHNKIQENNILLFQHPCCYLRRFETFL